MVKLIRHQCADIIREGFAAVFLAGGIPHKMCIEHTVDILCPPGRFFSKAGNRCFLGCDSFSDGHALKVREISLSILLTAIQLLHGRQIPAALRQTIFRHAKRCEVSAYLNV